MDLAGTKQKLIKLIYNLVVLDEESSMKKIGTPSVKGKQCAKAPGGQSE